MKRIHQVEAVAEADNPHTMGRVMGQDDHEGGQAPQDVELREPVARRYQRRRVNGPTATRC